MKWSFLASTGSDSWCKYIADRANNTQTCEPGAVHPKDIFYKIRLIFGIKERHWIGKALAWQNSNESFNGTIWERIPKILLLYYLI